MKWYIILSSLLQREVIAIQRPYLVGIAGGSASGKSTFCGELQKTLLSLSPGTTIKVFHMDDYFKPEAERPRAEAPVSGKIYIDDNQPETVFLSKLETDLCASMQENYDIVVVEGLLTLWDRKIYSHLNLKLFVDCMADERAVRRIRRNMQWGQTFDEITGVYLDLVRFRHNEYVEPTKWHADLIINGSLPSEAAVSAISDYILLECGRGKTK